MSNDKGIDADFTVRLMEAVAERAKAEGRAEVTAEVTAMLQGLSDGTNDRIISTTNPSNPKKRGLLDPTVATKRIEQEENSVKKHFKKNWGKYTAGTAAAALITLGVLERNEITDFLDRDNDNPERITATATPPERTAPEQTREETTVERKAPEPVITNVDPVNPPAAEIKPACYPTIPADLLKRVKEGELPSKREVQKIIAEMRKCEIEAGNLKIGQFMFKKEHIKNLGRVCGNFCPDEKLTGMSEDEIIVAEANVMRSIIIEAKGLGQERIDMLQANFQSLMAAAPNDPSLQDVRQDMRLDGLEWQVRRNTRAIKAMVDRTAPTASSKQEEKKSCFPTTGGEIKKAN